MCRFTWVGGPGRPGDIDDAGRYSFLPSRTSVSAPPATRVTQAIAERGGDRLVELREQVAVAVEGHVDR